MKMKKLTKKEQTVEKALVRGDYRPVSKDAFENIALAVARRKKDAVLNIRVNSEDLNNIKQKASRLKIPYQTFISELLHQIAA